VIDDWSSYFRLGGFIGRERELAVLERALLAPTPEPIFIGGHPGTGKTALAMQFADLHRDAFPAGVYHIHALPYEFLQQTIAVNVSHPSQPYLLILDDLEARTSSEFQRELSGIRIDRPVARLICIGRMFRDGQQIGQPLNLLGFNEAEFNLFLTAAAHRRPDLPAWHALFQKVAGNPLASVQLADLLAQGEMSPQELLARLGSFSVPGLLDSTGAPIASGDASEKRIIVDVVSTNDTLLRTLRDSPELLYELTPRRFEEIVADVLARLGYQITLTPASRDGGKDIYAAKKDHLGTFLYVVECKRYAPDHPVGVGLVRQLNGVVQAEQATAGILAATSFFTREAKEFQRRISNQMSLKDYVGIQEWLNDATRR